LITKIYGINTVLEALSSGNQTVEKVYIQEGRRDKRIREVIEHAKDRKAKIFFLNKAALNRKFDKINHQGVIAEVSDFKYYSIDEILNKRGEKTFLIILDSIQDQQNFGSIIRTAEFFGAHAIIITKDKNAKVTETTAKVSAGSVFHIPVVKEVNLSTVIAKLKDEFFTIVATSPEGKDDISCVKELDNIALIIGNEEKGIRRNLLNKSDYTLGISPLGVTASLNASASAAIFIYQISKVFCNASS